jgi:AcrR family transcriptional regulator
MDIRVILDTCLETQATGMGCLSRSEHLARFGLENAAEAVRIAHPGMDRRTTRTRAALHEALIRLIVERGYDAVTVADVTDAANVGRSTFYAHYSDKDALLRDGFSHLQAMLARGVGEDVKNEGGNRPFAFSRLLIEHLAENVQLYRVLVAGSSGPIIGEEIRRVVVDFIRVEIAGGKRRRSHEAQVQLLAGAYLSLLTWWLEGGAKTPAVQVEESFQAFAQGGLTAVKRLLEAT